MYYLGQKKNIEALKRKFISAITEKADFLDKGFLAHATDPANIIIRKSMGCKISLSYNISLHMNYREKSYYTRTKGYKVEARSDDLYITEDKETSSYWSDSFKAFDIAVRKSFLGVAGNITPANNTVDIRNCTEIDRDDMDNWDRIDELFKQAGFTNEGKFFDKLDSATQNRDLYSDEVYEAKRRIEHGNAEVKSIECSKISILSSISPYLADYDIVFNEIYTIGVRYNGEDYFATYFDDFSEIPVKYSQEALDEAADKAVKVKIALKKKRNRAAAVFAVALVLLLAMLTLTILSQYVFHNADKYAVGWIKYFAHFPESLIAILPIALISVAFGMMCSEASYSLYGINDTPSNKTVHELIKQEDEDFLKKRIFLYITVVIAIIYAAVQAVAFIWGPGFPIKPTPEESVGHTYTIETADDVLNIPESYKGTIQLKDDIDMNKAEVHAIHNFSGTFEGNGYTISNFTLAGCDTCESDRCGLFEALNGTVKNLTLSNFSCGKSSEAGGIAASNNGTIENCAVISASIEGTLKSGAIAGDNGGTIISCFAKECDVILSADGITGHTGGLAGSNGGSITNSYAIVQVAARTNAGSELYAGGLVGWNAYTLSNCYSIADIQINSFTGKVHKGGLCGNTTFTVKNCIYESESLDSFGDTTKQGEFSNCFSVADMAEEYSSKEEMFANTLSSTQWLTATMKWDTGIWQTVQNDYPELIWNIN